MSKIVAVFEAGGLTAENYDAIMNEMSPGGKFPDKNLNVHVSFKKGDSWFVVDVWNSEEDMNQFAMNTLMPMFAKLGITPPAPPKVYPLHRLINMVEQQG
jgi:hypothetical protein